MIDGLDQFQDEHPPVMNLWLKMTVHPVIQSDNFISLEKLNIFCSNHVDLNDPSFVTVIYKNCFDT